MFDFDCDLNGTFWLGLIGCYIIFTGFGATMMTAVLGSGLFLALIGAQLAHTYIVSRRK